MNRVVVILLALFYIAFVSEVSGQDSGNCVFFWGTGYRALHRSYPIGTAIQVYANGRSVRATITGRGAYSGNVVLELSSDAFAALADLSTGIVPCGFLSYGHL